MTNRQIMGQLLQAFQQVDERKKNENALVVFPDLKQLPPEISLSVLSHLNATDLCLAACVWEDLASDEILWQSQCRQCWGYTCAYKCSNEAGFSYRKLYMLLDEGTLTFNADPEMGLEYLLLHKLIENEPKDIAMFLHSTKKINWRNKRDYLRNRPEVLDNLVKLQNFENQFLPNALRGFFREISAPSDRGTYLHQLVEKFSERFVICNPRLGLTKDTVFVVCFSLILLSVDLCSPQVKNKMSKREFIRNTRHAAQDLDEDLAGHLYDNIYLIGHVAPQV